MRRRNARRSGNKDNRVPVVGALLLAGVLLGACGSGTTTTEQGEAAGSTPLADGAGATGPTSTSPGKTVDATELEACQGAIAATPNWAQMDRSAPAELDQVSQGAIGTVTGTLTTVEAGPVEDANEIVDEQTAGSIDGGLHRAFTQLVISVDEATGEVGSVVEPGQSVGILIPTVLGVTEATDQRSAIDDQVRQGCPDGMEITAYVKSTGTEDTNVGLYPTELAGVLIEASDGSIRSLDAAVAGSRPLGIDNRGEFLAS